MILGLVLRLELNATLYCWMILTLYGFLMLLNIRSIMILCYNIQATYKILGKSKSKRKRLRILSSLNVCDIITESSQSTSSLAIYALTSSFSIWSGVTSSSSNVNKPQKNISDSASTRPKRIQTLTAIGKELEKERKTKQARVESRKQKEKD